MTCRSRSPCKKTTDLCLVSLPELKLSCLLSRGREEQDHRRKKERISTEKNTALKTDNRLNKMHRSRHKSQPLYQQNHLSLLGSLCTVQMESKKDKKREEISIYRGVVFGDRRALVVETVGSFAGSRRRCRPFRKEIQEQGSECSRPSSSSRTTRSHRTGARPRARLLTRDDCAELSHAEGRDHGDTDHITTAGKSEIQGRGRLVIGWSLQRNDAGQRPGGGCEGKSLPGGEYDHEKDVGFA